LLAAHKIDLIFNLGDVVIPTKIRQAYLFDWPYAIYPESPIWGLMGFKESLERRIKLFFFRSWIGKATITIAQTEVARERLTRLFGLRSVAVVPNAVSLENLDEGTPKDFLLPRGRNLLCLTYYYPHKNLEILLEVGRRILERGLDYRIILTLNPEHGAGGAEFLDRVRRLGLEGVLHNVGSVDMQHVPSLYRQCDGLMLPTLLESFSGTYVEALFHEIPIFTSDLDFARAVCGECAWYFDPHDAEDILRALNSAYGDAAALEKRVKEGSARVQAMPGWKETFKQYQAVLEAVEKGV
jgi:glycosyltransferase involved in cell wall biosynthesis